MPPAPGSLSFCMIVKNEERSLARCLDSVRGLAGELIVVDTGSTDDTPLIAARYGAEVIPFDFTVVDFASARNHALARSHGRWILVLDADEALDQASVPAVEELIARNETRDISWSGTITRRTRKVPSRITWSGSFQTGRIIGIADGSMRLSTPRFWQEAGSC